MSLPTKEEIREATRTDVTWKPLSGYEHDYDVSDYGVIRRRSTRNIVQRGPGGRAQVRDELGRWTTRSYSKLVETTWGFRDESGARLGGRPFSG